MRRILEWIALGELGVLFWITYNALSGPGPLPERIPTHFGVNGQPTAWGSSSMLWLMPLIILAVYLIMTVVGFFPRAFNYPVPVTEENRARLESMTLQMLAAIKAEVILLFIWVHLSILAAIRLGRWNQSLLILPFFVILIVASCGGYTAALFSAAKPRNENSPDQSIQ